VFIEAKDDGGGSENWTTGAITYKSCKAPVKSPPPTITGQRLIMRYPWKRQINSVILETCRMQMEDVILQ